MNNKIAKTGLANNVPLGQEIAWWLAETIMASVITYAVISLGDLIIPRLEGQYYVVTTIVVLLVYLYSFSAIDRAITGSGTLRSLVKGLLSLGLVLLLLSQPGYDETSNNMPRG